MTTRDIKLLQDRTLLGRRADTLTRYLEALAALVIETLPPGGGEPKPMGSGTNDSSGTPNPVIGWAEDMLAAELDGLRHRAKRLEGWVSRPRPVGRKRNRRCSNCGNGLQRGANFCPGCGTETKTERNEHDRDGTAASR